MRIDDVWFLRGIVSSATLTTDGLCNVDQYTLYTKVSDYADWVE